MKSINVSRFVLGFVFSVLFVVGVQVMSPVSYAYDCANNSTNGGCKQASTDPESTDPAAPGTLGDLLNRFGIVIEVMGAMY
jgi:hypothetical protein